MAPEVRLNGPDNEPLGVEPIQEALRMAGELDVDLVEIVATATPPVCRLMEYGKFKYLEQKKAAEAKAKQTVIEIKEVKFRPGTDDGDYNIKMRNIRRFLADGDKVKVTLRFRGREITHQELGMALLNRIRDDLADSIEDAVSNALDDATSWTLTVPPTGQKFTDVRILTSTGKNTMPMMANGAIVKSLEIEVWYKKG